MTRFTAWTLMPPDQPQRDTEDSNLRLAPFEGAVLPLNYAAHPASYSGCIHQLIRLGKRKQMDSNHRGFYTCRFSKPVP
jgi:hypothetical protein